MFTRHKSLYKDLYIIIEIRQIHEKLKTNGKWEIRS